MPRETTEHPAAGCSAAQQWGCEDTPGLGAGAICSSRDGFQALHLGTKRGAVSGCWEGAGSISAWKMGCCWLQAEICVVSWVCAAFTLLEARALKWEVLICCPGGHVHRNVMGSDTVARSWLYFPFRTGVRCLCSVLAGVGVCVCGCTESQPQWILISVLPPVFSAALL